MKTVWTNGCFDILHIGHIELFKFARSLGDILIVGIDSDTRVKSLKGNQRPINNQKDRKLFLESISYIKQVEIFDTENELKQLIKNFNVDTIVVGDDYKDRFVLGSNLVSSVIFFPKISNKSTSNILNYEKYSNYRI
jgi:D-beta-D-heptose 7-phosphate kinase/D-beta-D-heptose 1-phosphate adenosyltransferase